MCPNHSTTFDIENEGLPDDATLVSVIDSKFKLYKAMIDTVKKYNPEFLSFVAEPTNPMHYEMLHSVLDKKGGYILSAAVQEYLKTHILRKMPSFDILMLEFPNIKNRTDYHDGNRHPEMIDEDDIIKIKSEIQKIKKKFIIF